MYTLVEQAVFQPVPKPTAYKKTLISGLETRACGCAASAGASVRPSQTSRRATRPPELGAYLSSRDTRPSFFLRALCVKSFLNNRHQLCGGGPGCGAAQVLYVLDRTGCFVLLAVGA